MRPLAFLLLTLCFTRASGQIPFTESDFLSVVLAHHPVAQQADLLEDAAAAYLQKARGAFDPKLFAQDKSKTYSGTSYYDYRGAGVAAETRWGIGLDANWNAAEGTYLNPESTLPDEGLWSVGATVRLGQGLFTDARRTALRQAEAYVSLNAAQRTAALNDLLLDAADSYWKWYKAHEAAQVADEAQRLAEERLEGIRSSLIGGDRAAIDTVEARLRWTTRQLEAAQAATLLAEARAKASSWLWGPNGQPQLLTDSTVPVFLEDPTARTVWVLTQLLDDDVRTARWDEHPFAEALMAKTEAAEAEIRLRRELLKPQLDARFLALSESPNSLDLGNDFALELKASMPLFLRKERGDLALARIEMESIALDRSAKAWKWETEAIGAGNAWVSYLAQWSNALESESLADQLLAAEEIKFAAGESSLFLLNSREANWLKARKMRIDAQVELAMAWRRMGWIWGEPQP